LFLKGGAGKVKVFSHSEVCVSNISELESGHGSLIASTIYNQQPVRLWHKMESQMEETPEVGQTEVQVRTWFMYSHVEGNRLFFFSF
jgi:hypothetical protein